MNKLILSKKTIFVIIGMGLVAGVTTILESVSDIVTDKRLDNLEDRVKLLESGKEKA